MNKPWWLGDSCPGTEWRTSPHPEMTKLLSSRSSVYSLTSRNRIHRCILCSGVTLQTEDREGIFARTYWRQILVQWGRGRLKGMWFNQQTVSYRAESGNRLCIRLWEGFHEKYIIEFVTSHILQRCSYPRSWWMLFAIVCFQAVSFLWSGKESLWTWEPCRSTSDIHLEFWYLRVFTKAW